MKTELPEKELCDSLFINWGCAHKCVRPKGHNGPHFNRRIWWSG